MRTSAISEETSKVPREVPQGFNVTVDVKYRYKMDDINDLRDFDEFMGYIEDMSYRTKRYIRDFENPIDIYTDEQFSARYRFSKRIVLQNILPIVHKRHRPNDNRGLPLPPIISLVILLRFYATGNFQVSQTF